MYEAQETGSFCWLLLSSEVRGKKKSKMDSLRRARRSTSTVQDNEAGLVHDNGAAFSETARVTKKKTSKLQQMTKQLDDEKMTNETLRYELKKARETIMSLQTRLTKPSQTSSDIGSDDFNHELGPSSTRRPTEGVIVETAQRSNVGASIDESRFLASMNQMSIASINIPECKPAKDNEEITRQHFEQWKELLQDALKLAGVIDESTQFTIFKLKAGHRLLEIFRNTKSAKNDPNLEICPFSNALSRLNAYFNSDSDIMLQRRRMTMMEQEPGESDLNFIHRVGTTARMCDFGEGKEFSEIVSTVAAHARNKEVRVTALEMLGSEGKFTDLVDKVR
ncbi:uncharacterized protein LOC129755409 [Uranotaenia lowii]|uniref:uncharacterized protein LOC129755409 n=1 Tax=Uranotaenia lowii TaxID=190385 RepID=UPI00247B23A2|nr:uncharacterized protein LOC129755409 [Uranotaenia lowii]